MRILLGMDGSKYSEAALDAVTKQFRPQGTEVRVVNIVQPITPVAAPEMAANYAPEVAELVKHGKEIVAHGKQKLEAAGFKADTKVETGDIRMKLIDLAAEWKADQIVLGSHGRHGIQRFLLGSVAEFVARNARCSVEIVRMHEKN
jgi:nucleotide-binding universal stress UspA family protein